MSFYPDFTKYQMSGVLRNNTPANNFVPITPSDVTIYDPPLRGITAGVSGNVAVLTYEDYNNGLTSPKTIPCIAGTDKPIYVVKVFATGTTADNIVGYRP